MALPPFPNRGSVEASEAIKNMNLIIFSLSLWADVIFHSAFFSSQVEVYLVRWMNDASKAPKLLHTRKMRGTWRKVYAEFGIIWHDLNLNASGFRLMTGMCLRRANDFLRWVRWGVCSNILKVFFFFFGHVECWVHEASKRVECEPFERVFGGGDRSNRVV